MNIHLLVEIVGWWFLASLIGCALWAYIMRPGRSE